MVRMYHILKVVLLHCNSINNDYQQDLRILYIFAPNKPFCKLLEISGTIFLQKSLAIV